MKCDNCNQEALFKSPTLRLCEACFQKKFYASFPEMEKRGLIERHGENWRITEKGRAEESSWDEAWEEAESPPQSCSICGRSAFLLYPYRGKSYCHECLRHIVEMVEEADEKAPEMKPDDYLFLPTADEETRSVTLSWIMADALLKIDKPDFAYAWLKCGFLHPDIVNTYRESLGEAPIHRLTDDEILQWENAITEYRQRPKTTIPASDQWVIVYKLKNGESCVADKLHCIDVLGYEEAKDFVSIFSKLKQGAIAYTKDGLRGSLEFLGENGIPAVGSQAIPRSDYNPKKHDTFHLRLGPTHKQRAHMLSLEAAQGKGLLVDYTRPGTAFDVMDSLDKVLGTSGDYELQRTLREAHPIVWTPQMSMTAYQAVCQLKDALTVEVDLMFITPALWLFTVPFYEGCPAQHAIEPFTEDGHIPFPDELVGDLGAPVVAILFNLTDTEITGWYFYLLREEPMKLEIRHTHLSLGTQPTKIQEQTTLKWLRFAASPYLVLAPHRVERHVRRRVEDRFPQVSTGVGVILLRRAERIYEAGERRGEAEVEWSCQWWVSGHWRSLRHPRFKSHNPIWIPPYIKGPPDKPMKDSVRLMVR